MKLIKNIKSLFSLQNKRALKEFYRSVHPDIFESAPKKVKEENTRSLKILNNYLDTLKNNQRTKSISVKFYIPEKSNDKSKRFLFFETNLESLNTENSTEISEIYYTKAINKLITNLKSTQIHHNPMKDKIIKKKEVLIEDADSYILNNPEIVIKSSAKLEKHRKLILFNSKFNNNHKIRQKEIIYKNIKKNLFVNYNTLDLGDELKEEIYSDLLTTSLENKMSELKIEQKIFYVSENIFDMEEETFNFFVNFLKNLRNSEFAARYKILQDIFLAKDPKLKIMLDLEQKTTPGFVSIDITEDIKKSFDYIGDNYQKAFELRIQKIKENNQLKIFKNNIEKNYNIKYIKLIGETDNVKFEQYHTKQFLFLTKLEKLIQKVNLQFNFFLLKGFKIIISEDNDKLLIDQKELYLIWNFNLDKILDLLKNNLLINKE